MDIASMTALITGARFVKDSLEVALGYKIENETRVKINEALKQVGTIQDTLFDLREELFHLQSENQKLHQLLVEKDKKIKELDEAFQSKNSLIKVRDAYYETDQDGRATGDPYCMHCWEVNHKKYHLHSSKTNYGVKICANCKAEYWMDKEGGKRTL